MYKYIIVICLILLSALFSGLTLGLMSLSAHELKRKMTLGDDNAQKVYKVRKKGNLLLTTLLVGNVAVNTALAIFLGSIASGVAAGLMATSLIVIFGEIIPQAIFSRHALTLGAKVAWFVKIMVVILYPICMPIAWALNKLLGNELATIYSKKELMKIIEEHEDAHDSDLDADEERIVKGALSFSDKRVSEVMTPASVVHMLEASQQIDTPLLKTLSESSYTRIPVYQETQDKIIGILYIKQLIGDENTGKSVGSVADKKVLFVDENKRLDITFNAFLKTRQHLFIVTNALKKVIGIVSLEDIIEEILDSEIVDETDKFPDLRNVARQKDRKKTVSA